MSFSPSYFNRGILRQNMRQYGWIGILYLLGLGFALPLQLYFAGESNYLREPHKLRNLFEHHGDIQMLFVLTLPVAAGVFLTRFMQVKAPVDLFHSLPLTRGQLFTVHYTSGLPMLLLPIWLTAGVTAIIHSAMDTYFKYTLYHVWEWGIVVTCCSLLLYSFAFFVGVCTGQSVFQAAVTYILLLLPVALIALIDYHLETYLYGYTQWGWISMNENISPLAHMMQISHRPYSWVELLIYAGLSFLFAGAGFFLYRLRLSEKSTQAVAFVYFNPLFQLGFMLCAMLLASAYFSSMQGRHTGWSIAGHLVGALLGYIISEMILRKTWMILNRKTPIYFLSYTAVLGLALFLTGSDFIGYESRVPKESQIQSAQFGQVRYIERNREQLDYGTDPAFVESVRNLHRAIVDRRPEVSRLQMNQGDVEHIDFLYKLQNGNTLRRSYSVPVAELEDVLKPAMEQREYKIQNYRLSKLDKSYDRIEIRATDGVEKKILIVKPEEIKEFVALLKQEYLDMSYEDMRKSGLKSWASIELLVSGGKNYEYYDWRKSFKALEAWLIGKGYADQARLAVADLRSAELVSFEGRNDEAYRYMSDDSFPNLRKLGTAKVVTDPAELADILERQSHFIPAGGGAIARFELTNGVTLYSMVQNPKE